jgi:hypothetical protein
MVEPRFCRRDPSAFGVRGDAVSSDSAPFVECEARG